MKKLSWQEKSKLSIALWVSLAIYTLSTLVYQGWHGTAGFVAATSFLVIGLFGGSFTTAITIILIDRLEQTRHIKEAKETEEAARNEPPADHEDDYGGDG